MQGLGRVRRGLDDSGTQVGVGELVVLAPHGGARVTSVSKAGADRQQLVVLTCGSGLTVTLPVALACESLRPLAGESELAHLEETLRGDSPQLERVWSKRLRATREKLAVGGLS